MIRNEAPDIVTVVACPPEGAAPGDIHNNFIDEVMQTLTARKAASTRIVRAATMVDLDLRLGEILTSQLRGRVKLQIIGHSFSGALLLGAAWLATSELFDDTFNPPFHALTPDPRAMGCLVSHADKIQEVMLVGCNVGSDSSYGYPFNGRTLLYALAELLQCAVRGADDMVSPDEFDARGWYAPGAGKRRPHGWQWVECSHPMWLDAGPEVSPRQRAETVVSFEVRSILSTRLPIDACRAPIEIDPAIHIICRELDRKRTPTAVPEMSLETEHGPAQLLCSGRYLNLGGTYYAVERHAGLLEALAQAQRRTAPGGGARAGAARASAR
ncbi:MAG TPA: hypothetical protein VHW23_24545 [Kofleriaceae bacterium]|jgi:hypothetical protein|nr:hypothetical protein [Kofleriaceae bacterium]